MIAKQMNRWFALLVVLAVLVGTVRCGVSRPASQVADDFGTIGGGVDNEAGEYAAVGGGHGNAASAYHATVGGGFYNIAGVEASVVGGGERNTASATFAAVGGGYSNAASGMGATVGGGAMNTASGKLATVGGGDHNAASGWSGTISGGHHNTAAGSYPTIGGGVENTTAGFGSTVGGGAGNVANANYATVGGGLSNRAAGIYGTVSGGYGNTGGGSYSTVPGGFQNQAAGDYSVASGRRATVDAAHDGAFLYADANDLDFGSTAANEFAVRATGGVRLVTAIDDDGVPIAGVELAPGSGSWSSLSDRGAKANVAPVDEGQVLALLAELSISTWNYASQDPSIRHIGPMAQDFYATFGVGEDGEHIGVVDADGVALAAIQGLYQLVLEQEAQIVTLAAQVEALERASKEERHACLGEPD